MFIQRDPIGLLGGVDVFAYAPNPIHWVDVLGLNPNCKKCKNFLQEDCDSILKKEGIVIGKHRDIKKIGGQYDSHHIYQDAAVNNIKKYNYYDAVAISLKARNSNKTTKGTPHYLANRAQDNSSKAGVLGAETVVAYNSLKAAGLSSKAAKCATLKARNYFTSLGANAGTTTKQLSRRKGK